MLIKNNLLEKIDSLFIEPTNVCNAKCTICERTYNPRKPSFLSYEAFVETIEMFSNLKNLTLQGVGESLMHPQFIKMCEYATKKKIEISFNTNASLLKKETSCELSKQNIKEIRFSIDSLDPDIFSSIRKGLELNVVLNNIIYFMEITSEKTNIIPTVTTVLQQKNWDGLFDLAKWIIRIGIKKWEVVNLYPGGYGDATHGNSFDALENPYKHKYLNEVKDYCLDHGLDLEFPSCSNKDSTQRVLDCKWLEKMIYITSERILTPCCILSDPQFHGLVNIKHQTDILNILSSHKIQNIYNNRKNNITPKICEICLKGSCTLNNF